MVIDERAHSCDRKAVSLNGTKSETRLKYQSELSKCGGGSFRLQPLIGLVINGTNNQISDRKILI